MPDYQNAKIYKIYSYENDDVYYGSTCDTLSRRISGHRTHLKRYKEGKSNYMTSFIILENESAKIELVENFPCNSKEELLQREGFYIRNNDCVNKIIAGRTQEEYNKEYFQENKEERLEQMKEYRKANINTYNHYQKEYMREYRQQKKEQLLNK